MKIIKLISILLIGGAIIFLLSNMASKKDSFVQKIPEKIIESVVELSPLSIKSMRSREYPGSEIKIEETLTPGSNYSQYIASYRSDGLKIYALLTVPSAAKPEGGWPVIVFNHGYIPPEVYRTTERYLAYVDGFARNGYIVFKPDYRGHGSSEGDSEGAYYSPAYTVDVLNALSSVKKYKDADSSNVGMWGHSLGGNIALRSLVTRPDDIKAAVIWAGVVGSYNDLLNNWRRGVTPQPTSTEITNRNRARYELFTKYGTLEENPVFWNSIDPTHFISDIKAPVQIHHGTADATVPLDFSESLYEKLKKEKKTSELYTYEGDDHNIASYFNTAMERSIKFFDRYLKS